MEAYAVYKAQWGTARQRQAKVKFCRASCYTEEHGLKRKKSRDPPAEVPGRERGLTLGC